MSPYIKVASVNILSGTLAGNIPFGPRLNLISGVNGTLKTKLLQEIKQGRFTPSPAGTQPKIQAISPRRNSERRAAAAIVQQLRQQSRTFDAYISEQLGAQIVDTSFQNYPSVGELFFLVYEHRLRDGGPQVDHMVAVTEDFNQAISAVFPEYKLDAAWDNALGQPRLSIAKGANNAVPLEGLSLGEQEVLSLITNLYASRDSNDAYLIDEPEVHLNWHLEEGLFAFMLDFCERYQKQMIVVTHSRIAFTDRFLPLTTFLYWTADGRVAWGNDIPDEHRRRLAGEAVQIIKLGSIVEQTFFVEDRSLEQVVKAIARAEKAKIMVVVCGNAANVRALFRRSKADGGWPRALFLEDGDNEGSPFPSEPQFLHLEKYCIENYLLDLRIASVATGKTEGELKGLIHAEVMRRKDNILGRNKFLEFLIDGLKPEHLTEGRLAKLDASQIMPGVLLALGNTFDDYVQRYVETALDMGLLDQVFPSTLINAARTGLPESPDAPDSQ